MAISKTLQSTTLNIEVSTGVDKTGAPKYKKKNFSGVKLDATPEAINNVAEAVKAVLARETRSTFVSDISIIGNSEA